MRWKVLGSDFGAIAALQLLGLRGKIEVEADVGVAKGAFGVWTCDLAHGYMSINGGYRS